MANEEKEPVRKLSIMLSDSMERHCRTYLVLSFLIGGAIGCLGTGFVHVCDVQRILKPVWRGLSSLTIYGQCFVLLTVVLVLIFVVLIFWLVLHYALRVYLEANANYDRTQGWSRSIIEKGIECLCTLERSKDVKSPGVTVVINHERHPISDHKETSTTAFTFMKSVVLSGSVN